jgi:replicative DNA helicase
MSEKRGNPFSRAETAEIYWNEQGVLGAVLIKPELMKNVLPVLEKDDFYVDFHRTLYEKMSEMYRQSKNIDLITLLDRLGGEDERKERYKKELMELSDRVPHLANIGDYCDSVKKSSYSRKAVNLVYGADWSGAYGADIVEVIGETSKQLAEIIKDKTRRETKTIAEIALDQFNKIILGNGRNERIDTGIAKLDDILNGIYPKDLITVAAGTSVGKTAFLLQIITNLIKAGKNPVLYSQEMSREQNVQRILARWSGVSLEKIISAASSKNQIFTEQERDDLCKAFDVLFRIQSPICDDTGLKVSDIELDCLTKPEIDVVCVDHIGLLRAERPKSIREDITQIMIDLKALASRLQKPIIALCQINREMYKTADQEPKLWHLKESGEIEQSSSAVVMLWRDKDYLRNNRVHVKVEKNRQGRLGRFSMKFIGERMMFLDDNEAVYGSIPAKSDPLREMQEALDI